MRKQIISLALTICITLCTLISGCSNNNYESPNNQQNNDLVYQHNISSNDYSSVIVNDVVYYCDKLGIWKKEINQNEIQLSSNSGINLSSNGDLILYTIDINDSEYQSAIRSVKSDGSDDREICKTGPNPNNMIIVNDNLFYTSIDCESNTICLFSYNLVSNETKIEAKDVYICSSPIKDKIVYLDRGTSEFSINGQLHLFDLTTSEDYLIDSNDYQKNLYQNNNIVYSVKQDSSGYYLCSYNFETNEQKEVFSFLENASDKGMHTLGVIDNAFYYTIEDYEVSGTQYAYYKYDILDDKVTNLSGFPNDLCYFVESSPNTLCVFVDTIYLLENDTLFQIDTTSINYNIIIEFFDNQIYYSDENGIKHTFSVDKDFLTSESTSKNTTTQIVLEDYLGCSFEELKVQFGSEYESTTLPGGGLTNYIIFDSLDSVAFGLSDEAGEVIYITVLTPSQPVVLCENINSDMTNSELLSLNNENVTINENHLAIDDCYLISLEFDNNLYIAFEWSNSNYSNSIADKIFMQFLS